MSIFDFLKLKPKKKFTPFEFPAIDCNDRKLLKVITVELSGVTYEHDGCYPQYYLPKLKRGEQVFFKAELNNKYDKYAVKVLDQSGHYIGWLPAGTKDVHERLLNNETVLGRFEDLDRYITYGEDGLECYDLDSPYKGIISYARYSKINRK